jgi:hypothetical protein
MGFLDTLGGGQGRTGSPPAGSRSPVTQSVLRNDSMSAIQKPRAPEPPPSSSNDRIVAAGAVLVVIAAVAGAAWLALRGPSLRAPETDVSGDAASTATAPAEPAVPKRRSARSVAVRSAVKRKQTVDSDASGDTATQASAAAARPTSEAANLTGAATAPIETISNVLEAPPVAAVPDDDNVYSGEGDGVVAPRLLSLGFVHRLVAGVSTRTSTIELVVSKSGDVERVKLFPPSRNWEDAMLLSRAKMFQFQPAKRNGFPVRYRFVMEVDAAP